LRFISSAPSTMTARQPPRPGSTAERRRSRAYCRRRSRSAFAAGADHRHARQSAGRRALRGDAAKHPAFDGIARPAESSSPNNADASPAPCASTNRAKRKASVALPMPRVRSAARRAASVRRRTGGAAPPPPLDAREAPGSSAAAAQLVQSQGLRLGCDSWTERHIEPRRHRGQHRPMDVVDVTLRRSPRNAAGRRRRSAENPGVSVRGMQGRAARSDRRCRSALRTRQPCRNRQVKDQRQSGAKSPSAKRCNA